MRFQHLFIMLFAFALAGSVLAQGAGSDAVSITRSLSYESLQRTTYRTDAGAGTPVETQISTITLTITNNGMTPVNGVVLAEDISWMPAGRQLTFSTQPDSLDGRTATWSIGTLDAGKSATLSYKVPGLIGPESLSKLTEPRATFSKTAATLAAPYSAKQGKTVVIALKDAKLGPISGAEVRVNTPAGETLLLTTDALGKADYIPTDSGFYTYSVDGYELTPPTTNVEQAAIEAPATAGAVVPNDKPSGTDILGMVAGAGPIIAVILFLGIIAFALYAYLTTSEDRQENEPMPPAPATRPRINDAEQAVAEQSGSDGRIKYAVSYGAAPVPREQENAEEAAMQEQTRAMIEKRKGASNDDVSIAQEVGEAEEEAPNGEKAEEAEAQPAEIEKSSEEEIERAAEELTQEQAANEKKEEPAWMNMEPYSGESAVVDDETIRKTIEELEALRAQLKEKTDAREASMEFEPEEAEEPKATAARKTLPRIFPGRPSSKAKAKKAPQKKPAARKAPAGRKGRR